MIKPFPKIAFFTIFVLISVSATSLFSQNKGSEGGSNTICAEKLDICFEDASSLLELPDLNGVYRPYSGQTWSASWGFWNDNDWPDLYINHHTQKATLKQFPDSHLVLDLGRDRQWAFVEMPGSDQHSATFIDIDRDGDEDLVEATGGRGGSATPDHANTFNSLHLNEVLPPDPKATAAAAGLNGPGMRGRSIIPLALGGQSYLFMANALHKETEYGSAVFVMRDGAAWQRASLFSAVECDNCDPVPFEIAHFTGATFGDISDDGKTDAVVFADGKDERGLAVFIGRADGKLIYSGKIETKKLVRAAQILDLDGDSKTDLLIQFYQSVAVIYNIGGATPENRLEHLTNKDATIGGFASGDFDNDSLIDVLVYFETDIGTQRAEVFRNLGHQNYAVGTLNMPERRGKARNVAVADYDLDGALDLILTDGKGSPEEARETDGGYVLLRGVKKGHSLSVDVFDDDGVRSLGALVKIQFGDTERVLETTSGINGEVQNSRRLHFGMGEETLANVYVKWNNGQSQTITSVQANQLLKVIRPAAK